MWCEAIWSHGCSHPKMHFRDIVAERTGARDGRDPRPRPPDCRIRVSFHEAQLGSEFYQLPPLAGPQCLVLPVAVAMPVASARQRVLSGRQPGRCWP